ncbi:MAG: hypothetical protein QOD99_2724 [Chthoniobacter sp.]|jgi:hypothetical protein|nr:hypothetical protein [Chthoniobacter sp.]
MRAMLVRNFALSLVALIFASCVSLREGRVVAKKSRQSLLNVYSTWNSFNYSEPEVYWVRLEGRDDQGRPAAKDLILWRKDWEQLRVGDHWDADHGFAPADASGK